MNHPIYPYMCDFGAKLHIFPMKCVRLRQKATFVARFVRRKGGGTRGGAYRSTGRRGRQGLP